MKIVVSTYMRVGSTLLSDALCALTGQSWFNVDIQHQHGKPISEDNIAKLKEVEGVAKTHGVAAVDMLNTTDLHVFYTVRNFPDTVRSRILYEKNVRPSQGLQPLPEVARLMELFPDATDEAFCNAFVEMNQRWLETEVKSWRRFTHLVVNPRFCRVNYDKFASDPDTLIDYLSTKVETSPAQIEFAKHYVKPLVMRKRYTRGHVSIPRKRKAADTFSPAALATLLGLEKKQTNKRLTL